MDRVGDTAQVIQSHFRLLLDVARGAERLPSQSISLWLRVGLPVVLVAVALAGTDLLRDTLPGGGIFLILLLPVIVVAVLLGSQAGLLALGLGAVGAWLLVPIRGHPWLSDPVHLLRLGLFLCIGAAVVLLASVLRRAAAVLADGHTGAARPAEAAGLLTERELEVLTLAAAGLSTEAIGERLFLSRHTIKTHFGHAYSKLGVRNRAEAVAAALKAGWIGRESNVDRA